MTETKNKYKPSKTSKTYQAIAKIPEIILNSKILAIDPSTGSRSSQPGYAWFQDGKLIESGELFVDFKLDKQDRLYEIARTIREDFPEPDILIIEYIPPIRYGKGGMNNIAIMALQKSIGAILSARKIKYLLEIPAVTWKHYKPTDYYKTDFKDAECLGFCAISIATQIINEKNIKVLNKTTEKIKDKRENKTEI